jgi:phosphoenolpyruvate-protein phosphotransferase (PTS system enzyme I)
MSEPPSTPSNVSGEIRYKGIPASPGVSIAPLVIYKRDEVTVRKNKIRPEDVPSEIVRLESALIQTRTQLQEIRAKLAESLGEKDASVFDAHMLVVEDVALIESVKAQLGSRLLNVDYIYYQMAKSFAQKMKELDDPYLQERAADIIDVSRRVLRNLKGVKGEDWKFLDSPSIIFSHDLTPSDTATLDRTLVRGLVTEVGSKTSHTAIMARSLNIPAITGLKNFGDYTEFGSEALLDGYEGLLIINPSEQTKFEYGQLQTRRHEVQSKLEALRETVAMTTDQRRVTVSANVELPEDLSPLRENGAEGIGLFRTEFLFLNGDAFPNEEEQVMLYLKVAEAALPHNVIIRTLDIGGDKKADHASIGDELNPFLGWRGIRYCLDRADIFRAQLRAICRASTCGNIRIMFPMITELGELRRAKQLLNEVRDELRRENINQSDKIDVGMMMEVPGAALMADQFAKEVDFFSIGTNDLIQYTLAVDRGNEKVSNLYQPTHPAVLRLIGSIVEAAHKNNIWVGVCGEMASDITLTPALIGLGVDELSLGSVFIPRIKRVIQALNYQEMQNLVADMKNRLTAEENLKLLDEVAKRLFPEIL